MRRASTTETAWSMSMEKAALSCSSLHSSCGWVCESCGYQKPGLLCSPRLRSDRGFRRCQARDLCSPHTTQPSPRGSIHQTWPHLGHAQMQEALSLRQGSGEPLAPQLYTAPWCYHQSTVQGSLGVVLCSIVAYRAERLLVQGTVSTMRMQAEVGFNKE